VVGRNVERDFRGGDAFQRDACTTDPDAKLYRKRAGIEAKLPFSAMH
jgi:hypothetical protein